MANANRIFFIRVRNALCGIRLHRLPIYSRMIRKAGCNRVFLFGRARPKPARRGEGAPSIERTAPKIEAKIARESRQSRKSMQAISRSFHDLELNETFPNYSAFNRLK